MKSGKGWPKTKRKEKDLQVHMYPCMRTRGSFDSLTLKEERQVKNSKEQRQKIKAPQNLYVRLSSSSFVPGRSLLKEHDAFVFCFTTHNAPDPRHIRAF